MEWYKTLEQLFIKFAPSIVGFLMEQTLSFTIIIVAAISIGLVYYCLSENQYRRVRNNPKNATAAIIVLALIILLLLFSLGAVYTLCSHPGKMNEKKTEPPSSTDSSSSTEIQVLTEKNKKFVIWIDKLIDNLEGNKEFQEKAMEYQRDLYKTALSLTQENEKCKNQLKACEENLHAGANQ